MTGGTVGDLQRGGVKGDGKKGGVKGKFDRSDCKGSRKGKEGERGAEKGKGEHCNVPAGEKYKGKSLGEWLITQRQNKKKGKLKVDREAKLAKLVQAKQLSW